MTFPMPSWSTILASTTADIAILQGYFQPVINWALVPILVLGVAVLFIGLLFRLTQRH